MRNRGGESEREKVGKVEEKFGGKVRNADPEFKRKRNIREGI